MFHAVSCAGTGRHSDSGRHRHRHRYRGRGRRRLGALAVGPAAAVAGVLAAGASAGLSVGAAAPASATPADAWHRLRVCESGDNYRADTGNGYYGAYQFTLGTWRAYGGVGRPSDAPPADQDYRARLLYQARGWHPWPACSRRLGLLADPRYGRVTPPTRSARRTPIARRPDRPLRPSARPARSPAGIPRTHRTVPAVARAVAWVSPDGGRWGRSAPVLVRRLYPWPARTRLPVTSFRAPLSGGRGVVRPL